MSERTLAPEELVEHLRSRLGAAIRSVSIRRRVQGKKKVPHATIWIDIGRESLKPAVEALREIQFPHLSVIAGADTGDAVRLCYIFSVQYGHPKGECMVTFAVDLPKTDLTVPTISDLVPGAVFSEREKQEFLGVRVVGIPDGRRLFLPEDFPEGIYPWRKDETGVPAGMVRELWRLRRPEGRPAPPAGRGPGENGDSRAEGSG
ncbi:MAG: NADH-quinone oxidoreductase subunit C [Methanolinea sp.]|nr:NADH-quinone oxidoreductase subunit C [Methanolinea sp.]